MGLDMYMYTEKADLFPDTERPHEMVHTWRKHNALHHWMEERWRRETDSEETFNCIRFELTDKILEDLEHDVRNGHLEPAEGFFFGDTDYDPMEYAEDDLQAIAKARKLVKEGNKVYYDSWW